MSTYIYAITASDHPVRLDGLTGVGEPASEVRTVKTDALTAVVSDAPEGLRAKRRDVSAHQAVLERLMADGAVLPMRFGLVGPDDDQVAAALEGNRDGYRERLTELDGCLEFNLKVTRDEDDLLTEIVHESDEIRRLNEFTREHPDAQNEKMRLGELITEEVKTRQEREAGEITDRLSPAALNTAIGDPVQDTLLNVSFLVEREKAAGFSEAVHKEAGRHSEAHTFRLNGPLPPYSFV
ncbi:GvpL/GvpF family gas vesicle protein [Streptomyces montanisoli]|uniref:GvpL/GvpF family gas vesicle protein n=1 Tax=Streptomyces montanisoli TaxID=2798581 RepID=A0A940MKJ5_9ACTN|nr:GvpL/GvpF family gas vesicle protein [Streptomyces montanisoli]MBP0461861.1 GvpL/GvpF family gas vesicle protein [Streptomyces montanisoli]